MIRISDVSKSFVLHNQGSAVIPVMEGASLSVAPGECVALVGNSGAGKSTLMRMIYGNYLAGAGSIMVGDVDVAKAEPREILTLRREVLGYVSQFLRVVPRVPTLEVVAEPVLGAGGSAEAGEARARELLARLNIPESYCRRHFRDGSHHDGISHCEFSSHYSGLCHRHRYQPPHFW